MYFVLGSPSGTRRLLRGIKKEWRLRQARLALDRLQRRKLVDYRFTKDGRMLVVLTDAGKKKMLEYQMDSVAPVKPTRWDGIWRIILFDIPENHKKARDALRQKFYAWGFYPLQKSVFVYPYHCEDAIAVMRDIFHIPTRCLLLIETSSVGNERELKKFFGLK